MDIKQTRDGADETKAVIYETVAVINRAFAQITDAIYKLASEGVLDEEYVYKQEIPIREMAARINCHIISSMNERELDDRNHYSA